MTDDLTHAGPYRLGRRLAEGGMAVVYEADGPDGPAAVKVPRFDGPAPGRDLRAQVVHEVQAMARLSHPHIVPVVAWGDAEAVLWMAMPLIADLGFRRFAAAADAREVLALFDQLLDALSYAHDRGVVHRDIKPRNLLVQRSPEAAPHLWLADFGIASLGNAMGMRQARAWGRGSIVGTPTYMALEQARGDPDIGPPADLYSVGVLLYVVFEGRAPVLQRKIDDLGREVETRAPRFTRHARPDLPEGMQDIVDRLIVDDPLERFPSASTLRNALASLDPDRPAFRSPGRALFQAGTQPQHVPPTTTRETSATPPACPDCGMALTAAGATCPACDGETVTWMFPERPETSASGAATASQRSIAVIGLAVSGHDPVLLALLERAGAHVEARASHRIIAALGAVSSQGNEVIEAAELALALQKIAREAVAGCGVVAGYASITDRGLTGPSVDAALALAERARGGDILLRPELAEALAARFRCDVVANDARLLGPIPTRAAKGRILAREREIRRLLDAAERAAQGRAARVTIVGRPGIGKSLLVRTVTDALADAGAGWLRLAGKASFSDAAEPLAPVKAAIRDAARLPNPARSDVAARLLERSLPGVDGDFARRLAALLDDPAAPAPAAATSTAAGAVAFGVLGELFERLTEHGPVVLAVDDLHWADPSTRELLDHLVEQLSNRPLFVLAASREVGSGTEGGEVFELEQLSDPAAKALVEELVGDPIGAASTEERASLEAWMSLAAGTPHLLVEVARLWRQRRERGLALSVLETPTLGALLQSRLDALADDERRVLELAAVVGRSFWVPLLVELVDPPLRTRIPKIVRELVNHHLVEIVEGSSILGVQEARFSHERLREGTVATVSPAMFAPVHRVTARFLERHGRHLGAGASRRISGHWKEAGEPLRASAWQVRAGARAEALGSIAEALTCYEDAAALLGQAGALLEPSTAAQFVPVDRPGLLLSLARTSLDAGLIHEADVLAERAAAWPEPARPLLHGEACRVRAEVARARGDMEAALGWLERGTAALGPNGDRIQRALLLGRLGWIEGYVLGRNDEGRAHAREALALVDGLDVPAIQSHIQSFLGANELRAGDWDAQLACNLRALSLAALAGDPVAQVRANINLSVCFTNRGALDKAADHARVAIDLSRRMGIHRSLIVAVNNLGLIRLDQGDASEAEALLLECVKRSERHRILDVLHETLPSLARLYVRSGRLDDARAFNARGIALAEREKNRVGLALAFRVEALIHAAAGDRPAAAHALEGATEALGEGGDAYEAALTELCRSLLRGEPVDAASARLTAVGADVALEIARWSPELPRSTPA
jgi:eukaryotic-like serine/threonine-protein kinase